MFPILVFFSSLCLSSGGCCFLQPCIISFSFVMNLVFYLIALKWVLIVCFPSQLGSVMLWYLGSSCSTSQQRTRFNTATSSSGPIMHAVACTCHSYYTLVCLLHCCFICAEVMSHVVCLGCRPCQTPVYLYLGH